MKKSRLPTMEAWVRNDKLVQRTFDEVLGTVSRTHASHRRAKTAQARFGRPLARRVRQTARSIAQYFNGYSARQLLEEDLLREFGYRLGLDPDQEFEIWRNEQKLKDVLYVKVRRRGDQAGARSLKLEFLEREERRARARVEQVRLRARLKAREAAKAARLRVKRAAAKVAVLRAKRAELLADLWGPPPPRRGLQARSALSDTEP